jgi:uncharacterized protein DUF4184
VDNVEVPFTLAHAAAALPFRRWRLVPSALVIGTFAPDFEYLIRFSARGRFGHTLVGSFILTLPLALLVLWVFHAFVKRPTVALLPEALQRRVQDHLDEFRFGGAARFALIVASILLGIATHLLWDSFTHSNTWPYRHWSVLRQPFTLPIVGPLPLYKILQHASTIAGIAILSAWLVHWYRTTQPSAQLRKSLSPSRKTAVIAVVATVALVGAVARAIVGTGVPTGHSAFNRFIVQAVVTAMAPVWWQLVAYGVAAKSTVRERQL